MWGPGVAKKAPAREERKEIYFDAASEGFRAIRTFRTVEGSWHDCDPTLGSMGSLGSAKQSGRKLWKPCMNQKRPQTDKIRCESYIKDECLGPIHVPTISDEWAQDNASSVESICTSSSMLTTNRQLSEPSSGHFHPRLDLIHDHISMRSNRGTSIGSSEASTLWSTRLVDPEFTTATPECIDLQGVQCSSDIQQDGDLNSLTAFPLPDASNSFLHSSGGFQSEDCDAGQDQIMNPSEDVRSDDTNAPSESGNNGSSLRNHLVVSNELRRSYRRTETPEHQGGNIQFSRQLSVGRLRDRVLRRQGVSVGPFNQISDDAVSRERQGNVRHLWTPMSEEMTNRNAEPRQSFSDFSGRQNQQAGMATISNSPLASRTAIFERRQRVRSQVHALQRLGSRFENLVGHDRSCILSGHYRNGRCLCRTNSRRENAATNTRASISRIVMLAEALFEVLDEIHQQSVVLSSRPSVSAFGSLPAPKEVVENLPLKVYAEFGLANEDVAQCQICLVEYAEGDWLRVLPCHHEFHHSCVDKWLKEIHRVCPLCRGNICLPDALPLEGVD